MSTKWYLVIVIAVSLCVHLVYYGHPKEVVFDEVHFGGFVSNYYDESYFFDIHPPLGKLLVAGFAKIFDFQPEYSFSQIGNQFPDNKYLALRFLPTLAGILFPIVIYLLIIELGMSRVTALAGGILISLENALLVESRFILMDMFLLLFGFTALLMYLKYHRTRLYKYLWLTGVFGILASSIKWTGIGFIAIPGLFELVRSFKESDSKIFIKSLAPLVVAPLIIYFVIFGIHFSILEKSGPGDAFMKPEFQKTLVGNYYENDANIKPATVMSKFIELNSQMYITNQNLTATHPYGSAWYTWPFMSRSIYFWNGSAASPDGTESRIYLLGNPIIWWLSSIAVVSFLVFIILRQEKITWITSLLALGYIVNMLPFVGVKRVMFLYHYLTAFIFAILILLYLIDKHKKYRLLLGALVISAFIAFIYFAPLSYGLPLDADSFKHRMWFDSWE